MGDAGRDVHRRWARQIELLHCQREQRQVAAVMFTRPRQVLDERLKGAFKPEFLNRVDETIVFESLGRTQILSILNILTASLAGRLEEKRMSLDLSDAAADLIADRGFDPHYGARPLKRVIQRMVQDPLAMKILEGAFPEGSKILADARVSGEALEFRLR